MLRLRPHGLPSRCHPRSPAEVSAVAADDPREGDTAGSAVITRRPGAAVAFDCLPRALGPPARVGGRLQALLPAWVAITDDAFMLSVIRGGFSIELADPLPGGVIRLAPPRMPPRMSRGIAAEVHALCIRGVAERAIDRPRLCLSLNLHISPSHFRMATLKSILKDAYHHVPIAPASRDILGFVVAGNMYRFKALPFGLKPAPRLFTRLVACVAAFLRQQGLRVFCYLDDWLLAAESRELLSRQLHFLLRTVQGLGFIVNWENACAAAGRPRPGVAPIPGVSSEPSRCAPGLPAAHAPTAGTPAQALPPLHGLPHVASAPSPVHPPASHAVVAAEIF